MKNNTARENNRGLENNFPNPDEDVDFGLEKSKENKKLTF